MKKLFLLLTVIGAFAISSCKKEVPTLTLSDQVVDFPQAASEKAITVTTNQIDFNAIANADWVTTVCAEGKITVKAAENTTTIDRKAQIMVVAGALTEVVEVKQAGSAVTIVTIPDKLTIDQWGGVFQFDVDANIKDWTITSDAEWVKLDPRQFKHEVILSIDENKAREARTAKLTLTGGATTKEFVVDQSGIMYFLLPYLEIGSDPWVIKDFEFARKSILIQQPDGLFNTATWVYQIKSPAFDQINYNAPKNVFKDVTMFTSTKTFFSADNGKELDAFKLYLIAEGFADKGNNVFMNEKTSIEATIMDKATDPYVKFVKKAKQPQPYPTFPTFPYGLVNFKATSADIEAYEATAGGTFNPEKSSIPVEGQPYDYLWYDYTKNDAIARAYFVGNQPAPANILMETAQYFSKMTLAFYQDATTKEIIMTEEFLALATKEGFTYTGFSSNWHRFSNTAKSLNMVIRWVKYSDMDSEVLDIHFYDPNGTSQSYVKKGKVSEKPITFSELGIASR